MTTTLSALIQIDFSKDCSTREKRESINTLNKESFQEQLRHPGNSDEDIDFLLGSLGVINTNQVRKEIRKNKYGSNEFVQFFYE